MLGTDAEHSAEDWRNAQALYTKVVDHDDGESQILAVAMNLTPPAPQQLTLRVFPSPGEGKAVCKRFRYVQNVSNPQRTA